MSTLKPRCSTNIFISEFALPIGITGMDAEPLIRYGNGQGDVGQVDLSILLFGLIVYLSRLIHLRSYLIRGRRSMRRGRASHR